MSVLPQPLVLQVLRFYAYFEEDILYSPKEVYRVRPVVIYYYLEDDSMCIIEPMVENSGIPQGKRIKRQRLPKNERGDHYLWKDLNLGMDLEVYGVKYHITSCDAFTKVQLPYPYDCSLNVVSVSDTKTLCLFLIVHRNSWKVKVCF